MLKKNGFPVYPRGFTLIEILIAIGIIAILMTTTLVLINPTELLRQARDSRRIADLASLQNALSFYRYVKPGGALGAADTCYVGLGPSIDSWCTAAADGSRGTSGSCHDWFPSTPAGGNLSISVSSTAIDGTGWVPVNFASILGGSPISQEPLDPVNTAGDSTCQSPTSSAQHALFYSYATDGDKFKLAAPMESARYSIGGERDIESADGGVNPYFYETGTNIQL